MNILQLSDPHLLADPARRIAGRHPARRLQAGLRAALAQLAAEGIPVHRLLLTGDLCDDESWGGYVALRQALAGWDGPLDLLAGNHDHPIRVRAVMGRRARIAPAEVRLAGWRLLLLHSHRPGCLGGWLGERQLGWLRHQLHADFPGELHGDGAGHSPDPVLVALHHPPVPIGDALLDGMALQDGPELLRLLEGAAQVKAVVFGHVHQHWQGSLPGRASVPLLACPSTLRAFGPVQPCPLAQPQHPGGRLLTLGPEGEIRHRLVRWAPLEPA